MLNVLSRFVPESERVVTIEDSAELQMKQAHVVRLETRPANIEGKGEITQRDLLRNSLRMRPDRIIVGEVCGPEVVDMLQAMNTGHDGSLTTIHANSPRDTLLRLETLVAISGLNIPNNALRSYIASAIDIIIQIGRMVDGTRKLVSLQEVVGMEDGTITMQEIFRFEQTGIDSTTRRVIGTFKSTGIFPEFIERFRVFGIEIPHDIFREGSPAKLAIGSKR
jgi:pilus assembly protein CpaF